MTLGPGIARTLLPKGFTGCGINCGVRKYRPDLGLLLSDRDAVAAAVYTLNECKAAPILYSQKITPSSKIRAVITNSGQANAATGPEGLAHNFSMIKALASKLLCDPNQILAASTGVIGQPLALDKILPAIPELVLRCQENAESFALAILTTDLVPKTVTTVVELTGGPIRITGIAKGSGMIHPNMGTMLGYLLTDALLDIPVAQEILKDCVDKSFNMISVDGDTSTNDCVFLLANGASGIPLKNESDKIKFQQALLQVSQILAQAIARDGEGATKLVEVKLLNAPAQELAIKAARGVTLSPLIKTAIHGEDPNWGRILARLGAEGIPGHCLEKMNLSIQGKVVFKNGAPTSFDRQELRVLLRADKIEVQIDLNSGNFQATAWGCDLSKKYVEINTEYS